METFDNFKIKKQLLNALKDIGISQPSAIQEAAYSPIKSGRDFVGIAQTGTGKTFAYLLPILQDLTYSEQPHPRVLILVPTRELVLQTVREIEKLTPYINVRVEGVYGGTNMNTQKKAIAKGIDILVGTPRRTYDLAQTNVLRLNGVKKLVIDEVDLMLDFGFKTQLRNIFSFLPQKRQNLLFSATMTSYVDTLINGFLINPVKKTIALSGTPLENITQQSFAVPNFHTKINLLNYILTEESHWEKVLVFVGSRTKADTVLENIGFPYKTAVIHAGKSQNQRNEAIESFENGKIRVLISTDVLARGVDIDSIDAVISLDVPNYPENYMHRIGRTGRASQKGTSILMYTEDELPKKDAIEELMQQPISNRELPSGVAISDTLIPEEMDEPLVQEEPSFNNDEYIPGPAFHEKSEKNKKTHRKKLSYGEQMKAKFKKPIRRGDKIQNMKKKRRKK